MVKIEILEHVSTASTYEDGGKILKLIQQALAKNEPVELSFQGITSVPSAFINSAIVELIEIFPLSTIKEKISFTNTTRHINHLIKSRIEFAISQKSKRDLT